MNNLTDIPKMESELKIMALSKFSTEQLKKLAMKLGVPIFHNNMNLKRHVLISKISSRLTLNEILEVAERCDVDCNEIKKRHEAIKLKLREMYDQLETAKHHAPSESVKNKDDTQAILGFTVEPDGDERH